MKKIYIAILSLCFEQNVILAADSRAVGAPEPLTTENILPLDKLDELLKDDLNLNDFPLDPDIEHAINALFQKAVTPEPSVFSSKTNFVIEQCKRKNYPTPNLIKTLFSNTAINNKNIEKYLTALANESYIKQRCWSFHANPENKKTVFNYQSEDVDTPTPPARKGTLQNNKWKAWCWFTLMKKVINLDALTQKIEIKSSTPYQRDSSFCINKTLIENNEQFERFIRSLCLNPNIKMLAFISRIFPSTHFDLNTQEEIELYIQKLAYIPAIQSKCLQFNNNPHTHSSIFGYTKEQTFTEIMPVKGIRQDLYKWQAWCTFTLIEKVKAQPVIDESVLLIKRNSSDRMKVHSTHSQVIKNPTKKAVTPKSQADADSILKIFTSFSQNGDEPKFEESLDTIFKKVIHNKKLTRPLTETLFSQKIIIFLQNAQEAEYLQLYINKLADHPAMIERVKRITRSNESTINNFTSEILDKEFNLCTSPEEQQAWCMFTVIKRVEESFPELHNDLLEPDFINAIILRCTPEKTQQYSGFAQAVFNKRALPNNKGFLISYINKLATYDIIKNRYENFSRRKNQNITLDKELCFGKKDIDFSNIPNKHEPIWQAWCLFSLFEKVQQRINAQEPFIKIEMPLADSVSEREKQKKHKHSPSTNQLAPIKSKKRRTQKADEQINLETEETTV